MHSGRNTNRCMSLRRQEGAPVNRQESTPINTLKIYRQASTPTNFLETSSTYSPWCISVFIINQEKSTNRGKSRLIPVYSSTTYLGLLQLVLCRCSKNALPRSACFSSAQSLASTTSDEWNQDLFLTSSRSTLLCAHRKSSQNAALLS
jgi:hypothetical protein